MKIHEYQAKQLMRNAGIPVPRGEVAHSAAEARAVAERLGSQLFVVKAQIHAGGRGKGGGIKTATTSDDVEKLAAAMLGSQLVTPQTGPEGRTVNSVLIEEGISIDRELYLSLLIDRETTSTAIIGSSEGGMDIEEVARDRPDAIQREAIDPLLGLRSFQTRRFAQQLGLGGATLKPTMRLIADLLTLFRHSDASLIEINPLVVTSAGELVALDGKINLDDNALGRHAELAALRDINEEEPLEVEASKFNLNYIKLDGDIGCMVNGAGLAMATMDIIQLAGHAPANFLDVGGGADVERIANAFRILTSDKAVKAVLVNIFGGIVRCDRVAEGIIEALKSVEVRIPMVIRLEGTNAVEARTLLEQSGLPFTLATTLADAAQKVVQVLPADA